MTEAEELRRIRERDPVAWAGREPIYGLLRAAGFEPREAEAAAWSVPSLHDPAWVDLSTHGPQAATLAEKLRRDAHLAGLRPGSAEELQAAAAYLPLVESQASTAPAPTSYAPGLDGPEPKG